jgi:very-short-patch-repair endonuclease
MRGSILTGKRARALRRRLTPPETRLWVRLRRRGPGRPTFRRQYPIDPYVADFCCVEARLIVEIDGAVHDSPDQFRHDAARSQFLTASGFDVLRLAAADVMRDPDAVADRVIRAALARLRGVGL